jgi:surface antigen
MQRKTKFHIVLRTVLLCICLYTLVSSVQSVFAAESNPYPKDQCTYYVAERRPDLLVFRGNAKDWDDLAREHGFPVVTAPSAGAAVVFEPGVQGADATWGHVAYVERVIDSTTYEITELNWGATLAQRRVINRRVARTGTGVSFILRKSQVYETDRIMFNPLSSTASSNITLVQGQDYTITISGSFSWWDAGFWGVWTGSNASRVCGGRADNAPLYSSPGRTNGPVGNDPEFQFAYPYGSQGCDNSDPIPTRIRLFRFSLDGGSSSTWFEPIDRRFNTAHFYQYVVSGRGFPIIFSFEDSYYPDNYGPFEISIDPR